MSWEDLMRELDEATTRLNQRAEPPRVDPVDWYLNAGELSPRAKISHVQTPLGLVAAKYYELGTDPTGKDAIGIHYLSNDQRLINNWPKPNQEYAGLDELRNALKGKSVWFEPLINGTPTQEKRVREAASQFHLMDETELEHMREKGQRARVRRFEQLLGKEAEHMGHGVYRIAPALLLALGIPALMSAFSSDNS